MDEKEMLEQMAEFEAEMLPNSESEEIIEDMELQVIDTENEETAEDLYETAEDDVYRESVPEEEVLISQDPDKKPLGLQKPILIACCILLASIIAFGTFVGYTKLFGNGVEGTWVLAEQAKDDEAKAGGNGVTYFTFNEDGTASMTIGSMTVDGQWAYEKEAETKTIQVSVYYFFNGTFTADVKGNAFEGRTLKLENESGTVFDFVSSSIPEMLPEADKKAKRDSSFNGVWYNEQSGNLYTFNEDGTCLVEQPSAYLTIEGRYSIEKENIVLTYIATEEVETELPYSKNDDGTITIDSLVYKKQ